MQVDHKMHVSLRKAGYFPSIHPLLPSLAAHCTLGFHDNTPLGFSSSFSVFSYSGPPACCASLSYSCMPNYIFSGKHTNRKIFIKVIRMLSNWQGRRGS